MTTDDALPPGEPADAVAGRYELGAVIGVGSSAVVRRGLDLVDGAPVAVKLFHAGSGPHDLRQQRAEITTLSRLDHPGLVNLHDGGMEEGRPFVVTDLVEGPSLAERIRQGAVPPEQVARLGRELAEALAHVHERGFVHRDVKPANVLLGDGSDARLADFGIARAIDAASDTEAGSVVGTAAYLAPEQARGEVVGPEADVYALGLVLLEAITGKREYPGKAVESAAARLFRRPLIPTDLAIDLAELLHTMTDPDPSLRPTAAAVATALAPWANGPAIDVRDIGDSFDPALDTGARHALPAGAEPEIRVTNTGTGPRHSLDAPAQVPEPRAPEPVARPVRVPCPRPAAARPTPSWSMPHPPRPQPVGPAADAERTAVRGGLLPLPRRAVAPLAAAVLLLAGAGGAAALFSPSEPTIVEAVPASGGISEMAPAGLSRP